ncbi:MAG: hypothetical protein WD250_03930 [Egibacteraceae bacterium]
MVKLDVVGGSERPGHGVAEPATAMTIQGGQAVEDAVAVIG